MPAAAGELATVGDIQAAVYNGAREGPQVKKFYHLLQEIPEQKRSRLKYFLGKLDGEAVAAGCLFASADALGFYDLVTLQDYRGRGIGRAIFHHLVGQALKSHHKHAVALAPANRQELLLEAGFFAVGEVAHYQFEP
ncbi:GNAT family N-acetyltransferase [Microbulbifer taiwanensis]|uniref:GNAT family N-acetyltransferase n=1 Tax=Microbulbifer taiwanensis TaxID=986746 RepID=UPI00361CC088